MNPSIAHILLIIDNFYNDLNEKEKNIFLEKLDQYIDYNTLIEDIELIDDDQEQELE